MWRRYKLRINADEEQGLLANHALSSWPDMMPVFGYFMDVMDASYAS